MNDSYEDISDINYNEFNSTTLVWLFNTSESQNETVGNYNRTEIPLFAKYPSGLLYFAAACCIFFVIIGVPGNLITIIALAKSPRLRNATSAFIINLCVADGLYCAFSLPLAAATFIHKTWIYSNTLCVIFPLFRYSNAAVSLFTVIAITVNRYVIIVHSKSYAKIYTKVSISIIIIFIWLLSFFLLTPTAFGIWGKLAFNPEVGTCSIVKVNGKSPKTFIYILTFFLPSLIFLFCYSRIFYIVRKSEKKLNTGRGLKKDERSIWNRLKCMGKKKEEKVVGKRKLSKDLKLLRVILVIFLAFVICYFPVIFVKLFKKETSMPVLNIIGYIGAYCTACINPIIYVIMSKEYRKAYNELFFGSTKINSSSKTGDTRS